MTEALSTQKLEDYLEIVQSSHDAGNNEAFLNLQSEASRLTFELKQQQLDWSQCHQTLLLSLRSLAEIFAFCKKKSALIQSEDEKSQLATFFKQSYNCLKENTQFIGNQTTNDVTWSEGMTSLVTCVERLALLDVTAAACICKALSGIFSRRWKTYEQTGEGVFLWLDHLPNIATVVLHKNLQEGTEASDKNSRVTSSIINFTLHVYKALKNAKGLSINKAMLRMVADLQCLILCNQNTCDNSPVSSIANFMLESSLTELCSSDLVDDVFIREFTSEFVANKTEEPGLIEGIKLGLLVVLSRLLYTIPPEQRQQRSTFFERFLQAMSVCPALEMVRSEAQLKISVDEETTHVRIYGFLLSNVCAYVASIPAFCFQSVVDEMLSTLLTTGGIVSLFVSDVLCFIARWGSVDVCTSLILKLAKMILKFGEDNAGHLFTRMFSFVPDKEQVVAVLLHAFPIDRANISVWSRIPLDQLSLDERLANELAALALSLIRVNENENNEDNVVTQALELLSNICVTCWFVLSPSNQQAVLEEVSQFWSCFEQTNNDIDMSEVIVVAMVDVTSQTIQHLRSEEILSTLSTVCDVLLCANSRLLCIKVAHLLTSIKQLEYQPSHAEECLGAASAMFNYLIAHDDWLVSFYAMSALRDTALVTPYPDRLSGFLPKTKKNQFTRFLKKESSSQQSVTTEELNNLLKGVSNAEEPCDNEEDIGWRKSVTAIRKEVKTLRNLSMTSSTIPKWYAKAAEELIKDISETFTEK